MIQLRNINQENALFKLMF